MSGPYTIGDTPWEYLQTLNMCIQLLLVILLGAVLGKLKIFTVESFVPQSTKFIFHAALPCLVLNGLGIQMDLRDDRHLWRFIAVFLLLRVIALIIALIIVARKTSDGIGQVAVLWLAMTWISTIIIGVPIASAVFDDPKIGAKYGVLAGISSFIFQLPLQLFFLECHRLEEDYLNGNNNNSKEIMGPEDVERARDQVAPVSEEQTMSILSDDVTTQVENLATRVECDDDTTAAEPSTTTTTTTPRTRISMWREFALRGDVWRKILSQVVCNPVLCAIALGFILNLSRIGPKYLNDKSEDFIPGLGWISSTLFFIGNNTVTPIALFAMGVWMQDQLGKQGLLLHSLSLPKAVMYMTSKLIVVPFIALGLAKAMDLDDIPGRAAVLIAALPISMASFSLANRYGIGETIMAENVALGTLLILPTVIAWNLVLDKLDLFPIPGK